METYISIDVETNGPIPGEYSMLSLGSVALNKKGEILGKFYKKLKPIKNAGEHPQTMIFWGKNKEAYKEATSNSEDPKKVIEAYIKWLEKIKKDSNSELVFVGWPITFDFMFIYWYIIKFVRKYQKQNFLEMPISWHGIDIRAFAMAHLKKPYSETREYLLPKKFFAKTKKHTHKAVEDAEYQGMIFINILKDNQK